MIKKLDHSNNFDFLRLLFASLVIVSHSFPLTKQLEIIAVITNNQIDLGAFSVECFFIMSGYMIFQSIDRSKTMLNYLWKRIIRIFPALIVLLLFTMAILPIFHTGNIFNERSYYSYFINCLSLYNVQYHVNGIFENLPYPKAINGSLWSLCYEFTMYISLLVFFVIKNKNIRMALLLLSFVGCYFLYVNKLGVFGNIFHIVKLDAILMYKLACYFLAGSVISLFPINQIKNNRNIILLILVLLLALYFNIYLYVAPFLLPIVIILIGLSKHKILSKLNNRFGDISYGVYIYGFFVQQSLMHLFNLNTVPLIIFSLIISFVFGKLSWEFVEKKLMKYKNIIS